MSASVTRKEFDALMALVASLAPKASPKAVKKAAAKPSKKAAPKPSRVAAGTRKPKASKLALAYGKVANGYAKAYFGDYKVSLKVNAEGVATKSTLKSKLSELVDPCKAATFVQAAGL